MLIAQTGAAALPSELVAARIGDVSLVEERGLLGLSRRGKIDQHGRSLAIWANAVFPRRQGSTGWATSSASSISCVQRKAPPISETAAR
jgi:hypothetical protein